MTLSPLNSAADPQPSARLRGSARGKANADLGSMRARRLAVPAITLLTAAMFTNSIIYILGASRAWMLVLEYVIWLLSGLFLRAYFRRSAPSIRHRTQVRSGMIVFVTALVLSTLCIWIAGVRTDLDRLLPQIGALIYMTLPFFIFDRVAKAADMERIVLLTCHVILALCITSIIGDFLAITDFEHGAGRYFGFLGDPVAWALTLPFLVYFSSNRFMLAALAGFGLALTGSRAPAICIIAALLLLIAFSRGRRTKYFVTLGLLLALAGYESDIFQTLAARIGSTSISANDRLGTAILGIKIFKRSPYFGMGYDSFSHLFSRRLTSNMQDVLFAQTSTFVQMLSDGGLILFLGYLAFVIATSIAAIALMKRSKSVVDSGIINGLSAWLIAILWVNQSATWFIVGSYFGPLVFGMAGILSGYYARLLLVRAHERALASAR